MGSLHFFLRVEVILTCADLFLSQHKYVCELLKNTDMVGTKNFSTPLSTSIPLHLTNGTVTVDGTKYHKVIGSLQCLSLTCLDISFAENKLS